MNKPPTNLKFQFWHFLSEEKLKNEDDLHALYHRHFISKGHNNKKKKS
jgi:hypothetical protein